MNRQEYRANSNKHICQEPLHPKNYLSLLQYYWIIANPEYYTTLIYTPFQTAFSK
jgi:hypothetical protein